MRARVLSHGTVAVIVGFATLMAGSKISKADPPVRGDINGDGVIDFDDINPFIICLTQGVCPDYWGQEAPTDHPSGRYGTAMAYDDCQKLTVLFGGWHGSVQNDTWEWNGINWTQKSPATSPEPTRYYHAIAYDSCRCVTVLFGGGNGGGNFYGDTWEYDGSTWTPIPATGPEPRETTMVYDGARHNTVLFGGTTIEGGQGVALGDTWSWDGQMWTNITPVDPNQSPSPRSGHGMIYDSARRKIVLYGGWSTDVQLDHGDTWEWDGQTWTQVSTSGPPAGTVYNRMVYDADRGVTVIFGIQASYPTVFYPETWEWNGVVWRHATATGPSLPNNLGAMVYDSGRATTVLFGGYPTVDETWEYGPH